MSQFDYLNSLATPTPAPSATEETTNPFQVSTSNVERQGSVQAPSHPLTGAEKLDLFSTNELAELDRDIDNNRFLPKGPLYAKYGKDVVDAYQARRAQQALNLIGTSTALDTNVTDGLINAPKNVTKGLVTGLMDMGSFGATTLGLTDAAAGIARTSKGVSDFFDELGTKAEKASRARYQVANEIYDVDNKAQYIQDVRDGVGTTEAGLRYIGRQFLNSATNSLDSGQYLEGAATGVGSIIPSLVADKGVSKLLNTAKEFKAVSNTLKGLEKLPGSSRAGRALPWALSMGIQEAGGAGNQEVQDVLERDPADLLKTSPRYKELVDKHLRRGENTDYALQEAQKELATELGREVGFKTAPIAIGANLFTGTAAKGIMGKDGAKTLRGILAESSTEPVEEAITEGGGQLAQNITNQKKIDPSINWYEGVGEAAAQGTIGSLGVSGLSTSGQLAHRASLAKVGEGTSPITSSSTPTKPLQEPSIKEAHSLDEATTYASSYDKNGVNPSTGSIESLAKNLDTNRNTLTNEDAKGNRTVTSEQAFEVLRESVDQLDTLNSLNTDSKKATFDNSHLNTLKIVAKANRDEAKRVLMEDVQKNSSDLGAITRSLATLDMLGEDAEASFNKLPQETQDRLVKEYESGTLDNIVGTNNVPAFFAFKSANTENQGDTSNISGSMEESSIVPESNVQGTFTQQRSPENTSIPGTQEQPSVQGATQSVPSQVQNISTSNVGNVSTPSRTSTNTSTGFTQPFDSTQSVRPVATSNTSVSTPQSTSTSVRSKPLATERVTSSTTVTPNISKVTETNVTTSGSTQKVSTPTLDQEVSSSTAQSNSSVPSDASTSIPRSTTSFKSHGTDIKLVDHNGQQKAVLPARASEYKSTSQEAKYLMDPKELQQKRDAVLDPNRSITKRDLDASAREGILTKEEYTQRVKDLNRQSEDTQAQDQKESSEFKPATDEEIVEASQINIPDEDYFVNGSSKISIILDRKNKNVYLALQGILFKRKATNKDLEDFTNVKNSVQEFLTNFSKKGTNSLNSESLDPEVLAKQHRLATIDEDGNVTIDEEASTKAKEEFNKTFGEDFSKIFTAVKRGFHLATQKDALSFLRNKLTDEKTLQNFLTQNGFITATRLIDYLFYKTPSIVKVDKVDRGFNQNAPLVTQIQQVLDPNGLVFGIFNTDLESLDLNKNQLKDPNLKHLIGTLWDSTGKLNKNLVPVLYLAGLNWLSKMEMFTHVLSREELSDLGVSPNQWKPLGFPRIMPEQMALQNLATSIRKMLGVAQANKATGNQYESALGMLAIKLAEHLEKQQLLNTGTFKFQEISDNPDPNAKANIKELKTFAKNDILKGLFRKKVDILEALIDQNFKNTFSFEPTFSSPIINKTSASASATQIKANNKLAQNGFSMNKRGVKFLHTLGGMQGLTRLFGEEATDDNVGVFSARDFQSQKGKQISKDLAENMVEEHEVTGRVNDPIYFGRMSVKNGRSFQQGSVNVQTNPYARQLYTAKNADTLDLTNKETKQTWLACIGQNFGLSTTRETEASVAQKAERAIEFLEKEGTNTLKLFEDDTGIGDTKYQYSDAREAISSVKELVQKFNNNFEPVGMEITEKFILGVLPETAGYLKAKREGTLDKFDSYITAEIDGQQDGPSAINSMATRSQGAFTGEQLSRESRTGNATGRESSSQKVANPNSPEAKMAHATQGDLHSQVAKENLPNSILKRLKAVQNSATNAKGEAKAKRFENVLHASFNLFKELGWLTYEPGKDFNDVVLSAKNDSKPPFTFARDVSKELTMVIGYGSQVTGTTNSILNAAYDQIFSEISKGMQTILSGSTEEIKEAKVHINTILKSLATLAQYQYDKSTGSLNFNPTNQVFTRGVKDFKVDEDTESATGKITYPSKAKLTNETGLFKDFGSKFPLISIKEDHGQVVPVEDIRNLDLTFEAERRIASTLEAVFGEPSQDAVVKTLGVKGMRGNQVFSVIGNVLNALVQSAQLLAQQNITDLGNLTKSDLYAKNQEIDSLSPTFTTDAGIKWKIDRTKTISSSKPLVTGDKFSYTPKRVVADNAGVAGGPVSIHASSDSSMMAELTKLLGNTHLLDVFDGLMVTADAFHKVGKLANQAFASANKQLYLNHGIRRLREVNKNLQKVYPNLKSTEPFGAIKQALIYLGTGLHPDGKTKLPKEFNEYDSFMRALEDYQVGVKLYDADPKRQAEIRQIQAHKPIFDERQKKFTVTHAVNRFFDDIQIMGEVEKANQKAISTIPTDTHHMSGSEVTFKDGKPLTNEEVAKVCEEFKDKYGTNGSIESFDTLMAAYLNYLSNKNFKEDSGFKEDTSEWSRYELLTGRDRGDTGYIEMTPADAFAFAQHFKDSKNSIERPTPITPAKKVFREVTPKEISGVLNELSNTIGSGTKAHTLYNAIFQKLSKALPKNLSVKVVSQKALASGNFNGLTAKEQEIVKKLRKNQNQEGIYISGEKPTILIFDKSQGEDLSLKAGEVNARTLAHEMIHAVLSEGILLHAQGKRNALTEPQSIALNNLEKLVNRLGTDLALSDTPVAKHLGRLLEILESYGFKNSVDISKLPPVDRARVLDEVMAYTLSNEELASEIANIQMSDATKAEQAKGLSNLLNKLRMVAIKAFKTLIGIINGSVLDTKLTKEPGVLKFIADANAQELSENFLTSFGANTLVYLGEETSIKNPPTKTKVLKRFKEASDVRKADKAKETSKLNSDFFRDSLDLTEDKLGNFDSARFYSFTGHIWDRSFTSGTYKFLKEDYNKSLKERLKAFPDNISKRKDYIVNEFHRRKEYVKTLNQKISDLLGSSTSFGQIVDILSDIDRLSDKARDDITQVVNAWKNQLDPNFLVKDIKNPTKEQIQRSRLAYRVLTTPLAENNGDTSAKHFETQAQFIALAIMDPRIAKAIPPLDLSYTPESTSTKDYKFNRTLEHRAINSNKKNLKDSYQGLSIKDFLESVAETDKELNDKFYQQEQSLSFLRTMENKVDDKIIDAITHGLSKKKELSAFGVRDLLVEQVRHFSNSLHAENKALNFLLESLRNISTDALGRMPSNSALSKLLNVVKGYWDKDRKAILDQTTQHLKEGFKNTKADTKLGKFLDKTMSATGSMYLSFDTFKKCLDKTNRDIEINSREEKLKQSSDFADKQLEKIKQLANYISGSRESGHHLLTNAHAIADLVGTTDFHHEEDSNVIKTIEELISLQAMNNLSNEDIHKLQDILDKDEEGVRQVHLASKARLSREDIRSKGKKGIYNYIHGWMPAGSVPSGFYDIIPESKWDEYKKKGFQLLGEYEASNIDSSEKMVRVYTPYPHSKELNEGILQGILKTNRGYQYNKGTRGEVNNARITNKDVAFGIFNSYDSEKSGNNIIPLFTNDGSILGYERSIPPEDREIIEKDRDAFSSIAEYESRQDRQELADTINNTCVQVLKKNWDSASWDVREKEFIDLFHTNNKVIKQALLRFDPETINQIKKVFGGDHLYVRRDEVYQVLGFYRVSATDLWDNNTVLPAKVENAITGLAEVILGDKARYYTGLAESAAIGITSWAKNTIVVRSVIVPLINILSNAMTIMGVCNMSPSAIKESAEEAVMYTERYEKLVHSNIKAKFLLNNLKERMNEAIEAKDTQTQQKLDPILLELNKKIKDQELEIQNLPIYPLIQSGTYSTISPEGLLDEEVDAFRSRAEAWVTKALHKIAPDKNIKGALSELLMTRKSESYQFLAKATNYGDWISKVVVYRYFTGSNRTKGLKMTSDAALTLINNLFVDYTQFTSPERDYLNRIGTTWFMTFKWRSIASALTQLMLHPSRTALLALLCAEYGCGMVGTAITDNWIAKLFSGALPYSYGIWDGWYRGVTAHPLVAVLK